MSIWRRPVTTTGRAKQDAFHGVLRRFLECVFLFVPSGVNHRPGCNFGTRPRYQLNETRPAVNRRACGFKEASADAAKGDRHHPCRGQYKGEHQQVLTSHGRPLFGAPASYIKPSSATEK
jgi:hypothetical protein